MAKMTKQMNLLCDLININVFKLGEFHLKTGSPSPFYVDLRHVPSYPKILNSLAQAIHCKKEELDLKLDLICGVPYTALPMASAICSLHEIPLIIRRKEAKSYGTKKLIEGIIKKGQTCLIIEDIVVSGSSILETATDLRNAGLKVTDCIAVLDRMQGGPENLLNAGIKMHSLYDFNDIFSMYCSLKKVDQQLVLNVRQYLQQNVYNLAVKYVNDNLSLMQKDATHSPPVAKQLLQIIAEKKSNLCVAVDVQQSAELLKLAEVLGPHICILKTHIDILSDFQESVPLKLSGLAKKYNFLILEDRKFADIGQTVRNQYGGGMYKIQEWANIITVHGIPGNGIIEGLKSSVNGEERACVLIAEMSSKGALTDENYQKKIVEMAESESQYVIGFISQNRLVKKGNFIHMFPGVNCTTTQDSLGQQYRSPESAVANGADVVIVGRGICESLDVVQSAIEYKTRAYNAYLERCGKV